MVPIPLRPITGHRIPLRRAAIVSLRRTHGGNAGSGLTRRHHPTTYRSYRTERQHHDPRSPDRQISICQACATPRDKAATDPSRQSDEITSGGQLHQRPENRRIFLAVIRLRWVQGSD